MAGPSPSREVRNPSAGSDGGALLTRPFVRLLVTQAAFGFSFSVFLLLPKILAASYAATPAQIGRVMASFGIASLLAIPFVSRLMERLGPRAGLLVGNLLLAAGGFGFMFATGAGLAAAVLRGLQGAAWSFGFSAAMIVAAELAPPARIAQAMGILGAAGLAMNALAPAIAEPLGEALGNRAVFALAGLAGLVGAALSLRLPAHKPAQAAATGPIALVPPTRARVPAYVLMAVAGLAFGVMFTFIAPFALERGIRAVRGFFAAYTVAALGVRLLTGHLSDRIGHARVVIVAAVLYGAAVIAVAVLGPGALVFLGASFGAAHGALFPALMALLLAASPGRVRAGALALGNGAMNLGVASVMGLGLIASHTGYPTVFVLAGVLSIVAALAVARVWRR